MIQVWSIGRCPRPPSLVCALLQVIVEPQVLIPKESHLLYQLIRSVLWRHRRLLRRRGLLRGPLSPCVRDISHVVFCWSCTHNEAACRWSGVKPRIPRVRWRVGHQSGFAPHGLLRVKPRVDRFPVVLEISGSCPPSRVARRTGVRGAQAALGGGALPPLFVPVSLGILCRDGGCRALGFSWRGPWP